MSQPPLARPDWFLPRGVTRSVWEYAHDPEIARGDPRYLTGSLLTQLDAALVERWLVNPDDVIDLGCGPGRLTLPLARRGFRLLAVDLSPESLQQISQQAAAEHLPVATLRANLCELDCLPDGLFQHALMLFGTLGMIEGPEHRRAALTHVHRLLRPGGQLVMHAHNIWRLLWQPSTRGRLFADRLKALAGHPTAGDSRHDDRGIPGMFHHAFSWSELHRLLSSTGFRCLEQIAFDPDQPSGTATGRSRNWRCSGWILRAERVG